jgi:alpha-glucosidase
VEDFSRWQLAPWANGVIYQLYPMSGLDVSGDGIGDLDGIRRTLWYLAWLGVRHVWLNPFYESPLRDNGYDLSDGRAVDPRYGDHETVRALVTEADKLGIGVIMDLPLCHVSDQHPWFRAALRGDREKMAYFVIEQGKNGGPPSNWLRKFPELVGGKPVPSSAWTRMPGAGDYWFMSTWAPYMPLLNLRNSAVVREQVDVMSFWIGEYGVAGFRLDYVSNAIPDEKLTDNPPNPWWQSGMPLDEMLLTTHTEYLPEMYTLVAEIVDMVVARHPHAFLLPEAYPPGLGRTPDAYKKFYASLDPWHAAPLNFQPMFVRKNASAWQDYLSRFFAALPPHCVMVPSFSNHDRPRPAGESEFGLPLSMAMTMMMLLLPGMPGLYYGQELGMPGFEIPLHIDRDPQGGRFRSRTPMPWDDNPPNHGFCPPDITPWLPVSVPAFGSVAAQMRNPLSPLHVVRRAIQLRTELPALTGGFRPFARDFTGLDVVSFTRMAGDGASAHVLMNMAREPRALDVRTPLSVALRSSGVVGLEPAERRITLGGHEAVLLVLYFSSAAPGHPTRGIPMPVDK